MSTLGERLNEWRALMRAEYQCEDPEVAAGREAEHFLRRMIETNLKHRGAYCFLGKRVPCKRLGRRFEVDLIVLTKKHLHFLEAKNWSGELVQEGENWVQLRRNGERIEHPNLSTHNSRKQQAVIDYLSTHGVDLDASYFSQKIIFMNPRLRIPSEITTNPSIVPPREAPWRGPDGHTRFRRPFVVWVCPHRTSMK